MRRLLMLSGSLLCLAVAGCTVPLTEGPTPFAAEPEPSPTPSEPRPAPPTEAPDPELITAQTVGGLYMVGIFPQDLSGQLDWSPDSRLLAMTTIHGSGIFEVGRLLKLRPLLSDVTPTSLALSPDGSRLVTGGKDIPESPQDTVTIWRVSDGVKLETMIGHREWINSVDYSPTGELVASGSDDLTVRLWRVDQAAEARVLQGHTQPVTAVRFSPDGQLLASGSLDGTVRLWRVSDGELLLELPQGELGVTSLAFSPDGITLAVGSADTEIRLFAAGTGVALATLSGNEDTVTGLDFSPDGSLLVSSGDDHSLRFWDVGTGTQLHVLAAHNLPVLGVGFSPDGRYVASGSIDGSAKIWGLGEQLTAAATPQAVADPIVHLAAGTPLILTDIQMFTEDQGWAIGGAAGEAVHLFRTEDGGAAWIEVTPPQSAEPWAGYQQAATGDFYDPYTGWIAYYPVDYVAGPDGPPALHTWRTSDGGTAWADSQPAAAMDLNEGPPLIDFAGDQFGWILGEFAVGVGQHGFALLRSIDSGFSWQTLQQAPDNLSGCHTTGMDWVDPDAGWVTQACPTAAGGIGPGLLVSHDGGEQLIPISLPGPEDAPAFILEGDCQAHSPRLFAPGQGVLAVECAGISGGYLYWTLDDGLSWTSLPYPGGELQFMDQSVGWALSKRIYKTIDGGGTWVLVKTVNWDGRFSFISTDLGWAIATNQGAFALVRTSDGAQRWSLLEPVASP